MRKPSPSRSPRPPRADGFVVGRARFASISAVEGIVLSTDMRAALERFDWDGLSTEERRRRILAGITAPPR